MSSVDPKKATRSPSPCGARSCITAAAPKSSSLVTLAHAPAVSAALLNRYRPFPTHAFRFATADGARVLLLTVVITPSVWLDVNGHGSSPWPPSAGPTPSLSQ